MRENSGKGESSNNLNDPTLKEHEAEKGKSGEAMLKKRDEGKEAHGGDVAPPNSDDAGATRSPEMGEPEPGQSDHLSR